MPAENKDEEMLPLKDGWSRGDFWLGTTSEKVNGYQWSVSWTFNRNLSTSPLTSPQLVRAGVAGSQLDQDD